ncbi:uncharacterized protein GGS25DRAFT_487187 [Hypoxylon fragiforme]|uniref:uncharacterized protein n=1 Tax=Hypoxylon fragiforme TaxID=63214 RepID=UPI0020C6DC0C|nr:uncharacterized protein GGS25DRAFT_487187 [Hypoxylon fragiforme]KAI2610046.1 hypothetical protein GGS25DRAFT_487187 [Hypoxylon fragiforme]
MTQDADGVDVTFSDGSTGRYDLVLGADGQWSRTRRLMFGEEAGLGMFHRLNVHVAYFTVPRHADETDELARAFQPGGGRAVMSRTGSRPETQAYLMLRTDSEEVRKAVERQPAETQKALFEERFRGAGWKADQFLDAMRDTKDFYADSIGQVKAPTMVQGRVALLGDAGCCASPVTGMGTTVSLITAYVLAGELARNKGNVPLALEAYNVNVKPYIDEAQKLMPGVPQLMTLKSRWAVALFYAVIRIVSLLRIDRLVASVTGEDKGGLTVPEYPELKFAPVA